MRSLVAIMLLGTVFVGCIGPAATPVDLASTAPSARVAAPDAPAAWTGKELEAEASEWEWTPACFVDMCEWPEYECTERNCERTAFALDVPEGFWDEHDGALEVSILWDDTDSDERAWFLLRVLDGAGQEMGWARGGVGRVFLVDEAPAGQYTAEVIAIQGSKTYEAAVELEAWSADREAHEMLPDIVVLPPTDLRIASPTWNGEDAALSAAGVEGCSTYEATEGHAKRCLRFTNRVGNAGEGPFEVHLSAPEGAKAVAGMGRHVQVVHATDGTTRVVDVGPATFHPTHTHFHYEGLNAFAVYEHDLETGTRGALVNTGHKGGVCLVNSGLIALGMPHTTMPDSSATCFYPAFTPLQLLWDDGISDWSMVLSPNWYDRYGWGLDDMYVDMAGAPDGVYELVSSANVDGSAVESDATNNEASVVFRLTGNEVETLT
ncbi:MAG TPA: hypothetical protein VI997_08465 [Candidatus Thermoplasmatota archaeon]|nr:hypothetical protein [Candidatus Thermoplasmatota archaeon]